MILWTIQSLEVYNLIQNTGVYHSIIDKSNFNCLQGYYAWLTDEMKKKIGDPPKGVHYPVWAWYMWEGQRKKPDLRRERWGNGWKGDRFVCLEIDIPGERVVLSDFDSWSIILLDGLISDTEEEDNSLEKQYEKLEADDQKKFKRRNWTRVFDLSPIDNSWAHRGDSIQATFWELRKEDIKEVRFFTSAIPKPENYAERI